MNKRYTEIFIPKFKVEKSYDLMDEINPKPIALIERADFSCMSSESVKVCWLLSFKLDLLISYM